MKCKKCEHKKEAGERFDNNVSGIIVIVYGFVIATLVGHGTFWLFLFSSGDILLTITMASIVTSMLTVILTAAIARVLFPQEKQNGKKR